MVYYTITYTTADGEEKLFTNNVTGKAFIHTTLESISTGLIQSFFDKDKAISVSIKKYNHWLE